MPVFTRTSDSRTTMLRSLDLFKDCPVRELRAAAELTTPTTFIAGRTLCRQGSVGRQAFILVDGEAMIDIDGRIVGVVGAGSTVGEVSLLDDAPRTATVTALTQVTALALSPRDFHQLLNVAPAATRRLLVQVAGRLRTADQALQPSIAGHSGPEPLTIPGSQVWVSPAAGDDISAGSRSHYL